MLDQEAKLFNFHGDLYLLNVSQMHGVLSGIWNFIFVVFSLSLFKILFIYGMGKGQREK